MSGGVLVERVRDWVAGRSWWTLGAIMAVFFAAGTYGIQAVIWPPHTGWAWITSALIGGIFYGTFMAIIFRNLQRKYGGRDTARAVENAIKKGRLPDNVQVEVWLPLLERKRRSEGFWAWAGPLEFGLFAALEVYLAITEPGILFWWLAAAVFVGLGVWMPLWAHRRRPRIETLIASLKKA